MLANELNLKTLESRIEENEERNKIWNDKVQKIEDNINEPSGKKERSNNAKKLNDRLHINKKPTTITLDATKVAQGCDCNIF